MYRKVTFLINDSECIKKIGINIEVAGSDFIAVYTLYSQNNEKSPDRYKLEDASGNAISLHSLNPYQRGILNDCKNYFMNPNKENLLLYGELLALQKKKLQRNSIKWK